MPEPPGPEHFDVFLSYAHVDAGQVHRLAENLHHAGLVVFLDAWEIAPGDVLVHQLERGILNSRNGILAVTPAALSRPWVQEEYAALLTRAVAGQQRLIPVLLADTDLPPFLGGRIFIDLRRADGPEYEREVRKLIDFLQGKKPGPPPRTGELLPREGSAIRREEVISRRLRISRAQVTLLREDTVEAEHAPKEMSFRTEHELVWNLERLRHGQLPDLPEEAPLYRAAGADAAPGRASKQQGLLLEVGAALGAEFLAGAAGEALGHALAEAERLGAPFELALEAAEDLARFPWETLRLPGPGGLPEAPLALHPNVRLFRAVSGLGPTPHRPVPGPLRILVAIGSPEEQNDRGELLDMEKELFRILDAVEPARKQSRPARSAYVRVLERGTVKAIRDALAAERYHVLHVTCHAGPGVLVLEAEDGSADPVNAGRFCADALLAGRGVPVVVLAGCATALSGPASQEGEAALPGFARELLAHGVPAVVAMQAPVSDPYATELGARFYRTLAIAGRPDPLLALVEARRSVETDRQNGTLAGRGDLAEWATPSLWLRGPSLPLYDPALPFEEIQPPPEPHLADRVVVRPVGEFVGRRREKRQILQTLAHTDHDGRAGVLLHGLGGAGKSSLSAEVLRALLEDRWLVASVHGETAPDDVLAEVGRGYLAAYQQEGLSEADPRRRLAVHLGRPDVDWEERFELLARILLGDRPLVLLLDNFEDNLVDGGLGPTLKSEDLAALLARWVRNPGRSRFLVTSRPPFELPDRAHRRLETLHLGPLSFAETRKLIWRLPGLDALKPADQLRAYTDVGGHPRALEYLDVLLRGGASRFPDVAERMEAALEKKGVRHPEAWLRRAQGNLDQALAEAVTLAVDDVLLDRLLEKLEGVALARELLLGASVYRIPVDVLGLAWQVGEEIENPEDGPPLAVPEGFAEALAVLGSLGLLAPVAWSGTPEDTRFAIHRWTAGAVLRRSPDDAVRESHRRAARHWRWRVQRVPQSRQDDIAQLFEARHHHREARDVDAAVEVTEVICRQLDTWGAWRREEQLCREVLTWLPERSGKAAAFLHQLGNLAYQRGAYDQALDWYKRALPIKEELGDRSGMAGLYHQIGMVAQDRGAYDEALDWYKKSLLIKEELGNRAGMASSYHQLGMVAQDRGAYDEALDWYKRSLLIDEELGNRAGMAISYHQLGMVAQDRGAYDEALDWYKRSLQIEEEPGNRAGIASSYHQLGRVAEERGAYDEALDWYKKSLLIAEELGLREGMSFLYHQLGMVAQDRGAYDEALDWYKRSLLIKEELGNRAGMASSYSQLGVLATVQGRPEEGMPLNLRGLAIHLELQSPNVRIDRHWLRRQRELLGEERFGELLREHVGDEGAETVLGLMAQTEAGGGAATAAT